MFGVMAGKFLVVDAFGRTVNLLSTNTQALPSASKPTKVFVCKHIGCGKVFSTR
ncbi:hypothetical protein DSO57_1006862 [Entomophthora muscae]|uniref:Uncharacterized protein n=1 Tax=Entomophthora muscae TaxID=34485 RepID=A0ACC2SKJ2_9FUNG|nr:hypothetical protein DSO57_1006862 [Entomophthora muscae]